MSKEKDLRHPAFNKGLLFAHLPEMMYFQSKQNKSIATLIEKIASLANPHINKEQMKRENNAHIKKLINGDTSEETIKAIYGDSFDYSAYEEYLDSIDPKTIGGWLTLESTIKGMLFSISKHQKDDLVSEELHQYIEFLLSLCEVDKAYLAFARKKDPESTADVTEVNNYLNEWLGISNIDINSLDIRSSSELIIVLLLHWLALFEYYLFFRDEKEGFSTEFIKILPAINKKDNIIFSNEMFITEIKTIWAEREYSKANISWSDFFKDIERAKTSDNTLANIDPDTSTAKKAFYRLRKGDSTLSIEKVKKNISILFTPYDPEDFDISYLVIVFIQLFDNIQRQIINEGVPKEFIVEQFARYPEYLKLVKRRYEGFKKTGAIKP